MKQAANFWRSFLIVIGLSLLLTWLFVHSARLGKTSGQHVKVLAAIHNMKAAEAQLNRDLLLLRIGLVSHYDDINTAYQTLTQSIRDLKQAAKHGAYGNSEQVIVDQVARLHTILQQKESVSEKIKTKNALLYNSLYYFFLSSNVLAAEMNKSQQAYHTHLILLHQLVNKVLRFSQIADPKTPQGRRELSQTFRHFFSMLEHTDNAQIKVQVNLLRRHSELIIKNLDIVDAFLQSTVNATLDRQLDNLKNSYMTHYDLVDGQTQIYQTLLYLVSLLLLFYLIYLFLRLNGSTKALAEANRGMAMEILERKEIQRALSYQASHDMLTGLYNRRAFEERLKQGLLQAQKEKRQHALCYLDLDQFKVVNDTCGHGAGDELLKQITGLLQTQIEIEHLLGRLGGDEFGVLLYDIELEQAKKIAEEICFNMRSFRFNWQERLFEIGVSIGLVMISENSETMEDLLTQADVACYIAKDMGRNRVQVHHSSNAELRQRWEELHWAANIQKALDDNQFQLYCQRIQPLKHHESTDNSAHYEILLRCYDDNGKLLMPGTLIPAAERYNLIGAIDRWVIHEAFRVYHHYAKNQSQLYFSLNLSGNSLNDDKFLDYICEQLERFSIPTNRICFEITETAAINNLQHTAQFIRELQGKGCHFALDDFGTGLSSFAYLRHLPVDYLKIDGSFVHDIAENAVNLAIVSAINQIGHVLQMQTIAEYAENDAVIHELEKMGVDFAQGYGVSRPQPINTLLSIPQMSKAVKSSAKA